MHDRPTCTSERHNRFLLTHLFEVACPDNLFTRRCTACQVGSAYCLLQVIALALGFVPLAYALVFGWMQGFLARIDMPNANASFLFAREEAWAHSLWCVVRTCCEKCKRTTTGMDSVGDQNRAHTLSPCRNNRRYARKEARW